MNEYQVKQRVTRALVEAFRRLGFEIEEGSWAIAGAECDAQCGGPCDECECDFEDCQPRCGGVCVEIDLSEIADHLFFEGLVK